MNDVEVFTKNITIIVQLDEYDGKGLDVVVEAGDYLKVVAIAAYAVEMRSIDKKLYIIHDQFMTYLPIDSIKVKSKYPVLVRYSDVVLGKSIEPRASK